MGLMRLSFGNSFTIPKAWAEPAVKGGTLRENDPPAIRNSGIHKLFSLLQLGQLQWTWLESVNLPRITFQIERYDAVLGWKTNNLDSVLNVATSRACPTIT